MATAYTLTLDHGQVDRVGGDAAFAEVTDVTRRVLNRATVLTPVRTGRLRAGNNSTVIRSGTRTVGTVFNEVAYAPAVHDGTKAHTVRPVRRKALRFRVGGRTVFSMWAHVPARHGKPWLLRALREVATPLGYRINTP